MTGTGTIGDPYIITTRADLEAVNDHLDAYYELGADISLAGKNWWPLSWANPYDSSKENTGFSGHFDGKSHTISGMVLDLDVGRDSDYNDSLAFIGLFSYLQGATVQNLKLNNCSITVVGTSLHDADYIGLLCGWADSTKVGVTCYVTDVVVCNGRITTDVYGIEVGLLSGGAQSQTVYHGCQAYGTIVNSGSYSFAYGGLVGYLLQSVVEECRAEVIVTNTSEGFCDIGGFVGLVAAAQGSVTLTDCVGKLTINSLAAYEAGGFCGYVDVPESSVIFTRCMALGAISVGSYGGGFAGSLRSYNGSVGRFIDCCSLADVTVSGQYSGGFIGDADFVELTHCYSAGGVVGGSSVGGLVGAQSASTADSCYWDTETSGQATSALGTGKITSEMQTQSTFTGWDFSTVWNIASGTYPFLRTAFVTLTDRCASAAKSFAWWKNFRMCKVA